MRAASDPIPAPLGRAAEARRLGSLAAEVIGGSKRGALLVGDPGIGKTTLLQWIREAARASRLAGTLVRLPGHPGVPTSYLLTRVLEGLGDDGAGTKGPLSITDVVTAFERLGARGPICILVDDYHAAPAEATDLLVAALRVAEIPALFAATLRQGARRASPPPESTSDLWIETLALGPLATEAVGRLAAELLGAPLLPSALGALHERALGNPLFVVESLRSWREGGLLTRVGSHWGLAGDVPPGFPASLRDMVGSRVERLAPEAVAVARALAVFGREVAFDELGAATGAAPDGLTDLLGALTEQGLVVEDESGVAYRLAHPAYETAILASMPKTRRRAEHGRILGALRARASAGRPVLPTELAHHAASALEPPPDLPELLGAAAEAAEAAQDFPHAAHWYGELARAAPDAASRQAALERQAVAAARVEPRAGLLLLDQALAGAAPATATALLRARASLQLRLGEPAEALASLAAALGGSAAPERIPIRLSIAILRAASGDRAGAERDLTELAVETEGTEHHHDALAYLATMFFIGGDLRRARALYADLLERAPGESQRVVVGPNLAWVQVLLGEWEAADALFGSLRRSLEAAGNVWVLASILGNLARFKAWRGDVADAIDDATHALRLARRLGTAPDQVQALDALGTAFLENGMAAQALVRLAEVPRLAPERSEHLELSLSYATLAEAQAATGDLSAAAEAAARARAHLGQSPHWAVAVERAEAIVALAGGAAEKAAAIAGARAAEPSPMPFWQAGILEVLARALWEGHRRDEALARAGEAEAAYARLGARLRLARLREWIAAREGHRGGRPRSELPGGLTPREVEVLRLIVAGRSNREIATALTISLGTAKKHVENLLMKAGVTRRTELLLFAIRMGIAFDADD